MASRYPLVMVIEDLHWADPALLDFVEYVGEWSGIPMLMLCSARLDILERDRRWGGGKRNASTMSLAPLNSEDTRRLISLLLPSGIAAATRDFLAERTGGNPLFAEEFARMLIDRPSLAEEDRTAPPVAGDSTPENLKAIIAARLDTLPAPQKSLLQDASVVGKVFWPGALAAIGESDGGRVHEGLKELTRKEFVRASRVSSVEHEMEYSFWHALIRDVTYSQIPRATRARKHIAAARWIEGLAGERISDHAELLAYHFEQALTMSKLAGIGAEIASLEEATRRYWMLAGERAMGLDVSRALACFDRALELSPVDDEVRARLLARKAEAASDAGRYETAQQAYVEAIEAFRGQGNLVGAGESLDKLATVLWERGDTKTSRARLAEAVEVLAGQLPGPELAHCYTSVASDRLVTGRFGEAVEWSDRALDLAEKLGEERLVPRALNYRGMSRCYLGDPGGFDDLRHALELTERLGSSREKARALVILTEVQWATEHPVRALRAAEEGADFASRRGLDDMVIGCRTQTLGPLFDLGRWDEVLEVADEVIRWSDTSGGTYSASLAVPWKEQVLLWRGQTSEAESIASDSLARARGMKDPQVLVPSVVVAAMVGLGQGRREEAIRLVRDLDETTEVAINWYREEFIADLARICCGVGDVELGRTLIAKAEPFATRHRLSILSGQATLDEAIGQLGRAADTYRAASFRWSEYGNVFEAGLARLGQGRCLARMGHPDARDHLLKARSVFRELGATVLLAETDQWLQEPQAPELRDHPD
jgi:tetratricopeptide (TPR) repeat protein